MALTFNHTLEYSISAKELIEALQNENHWIYRTTHLYEGSTLEKFETSDEGSIKHVNVEISNRIPGSDLPDQLKSIKPEGIVIDRTENWTIDNNLVGALFTSKTQEAPASFNGSLTLDPKDENNCIVIINAVAEVKIPIFGKKIEEGIVESLGKMLMREQELTEAWIKENQLER